MAQQVGAVTQAASATVAQPQAARPSGAPSIAEAFGYGGPINRRSRGKKQRKTTHPMQIVAAILAAEEQRRAKSRRG